MGKFFDHYPEKIESLDLFAKPDEKPDIKQQRQLKLFRALYQEGENLDGFCKKQKEEILFEFSQKQQIMQSYIATLQYIGLNLTSRALSKYALFFDFTADEYQNLVDYLTGNYCSTNLTVTGIKRLKKTMKLYYDRPHSYNIPSIKNNPLFPRSLQKSKTEKDYREQEFLHTTKLFQAFCSWGNNPDNLRLLVPLVRDPSLTAFVIRQMAGKKIALLSKNQHAVIKKDDSTVQIWCENLICRKKQSSEFQNKLEIFFGGEDISIKLSQLYCQEFKKAKYKIKDQVSQIKKIILKRDQSEENLMLSQFISLLTGIPNVLLWADSYNDGKKILQAHTNDLLDYWASKSNSEHHKTLYLEESLAFELVDRKLYFDRTLPKFKIIFDVNSGEFDRINQIIGKLSTSFDIQLNYLFLQWLQSKMSKNQKKKKSLKKAIISRIEDQIDFGIHTLKIPAIKSKLSPLIAKELLAQLGFYKGDFFKQKSFLPIKIPIIFNYAPFALKYNRYRHRYKRKLSSLKKNH